MLKPSDVVELAGFGFLAAAAFHTFGQGAGEAVVGVELVLVSLTLDGVKLPRWRFWKREK